MAEYDLVIRGGTVVDGTGVPRIRADLAIKDGRVAQISGRCAAGGVLAFDYRVLHAGNPCARHRPVAYFVVNTRDDAGDDAWNWAPERLLPPGG